MWTIPYDVYTPHKRSTKMEMIQSSFVEKIHGIPSLSYWEQLTLFKAVLLGVKGGLHYYVYTEDCRKQGAKLLPSRINGTEMNGIKLVQSNSTRRKCRNPNIVRSPFQQARKA